MQAPRAAAGTLRFALASMLRTYARIRIGGWPRVASDGGCAASVLHQPPIFDLRAAEIKEGTETSSMRCPEMSDMLPHFRNCAFWGQRFV